jgi:malate dehydrogenase (oxaloacetate-decarboxylating)(NADP+)
MLNAFSITGKKLQDVKLVINGAGAAAVSCARLYKRLGIKGENIIMLDSKGVITTSRTDLNKYKLEFARDLKISTLEEP